MEFLAEKREGYFYEPQGDLPLAPNDIRFHLML
jgi:hypothetical protein